MELLAENPYWTTRRAAERLKVAFTTAQRAVVKLEALGIMRQVTEAKRDRGSSKSSIPRRGQASASAASYPSSGSPDRGVLRTIESNRFVTEVTWIDGEL